jgi:hypothetical protein
MRTTQEITSILLSLAGGFIKPFRRALHLSLSWSWEIQSIPPHTITPRSILILSTYLHLGLPSPSSLLPSNFPTNNWYAFLFSPIHASWLTHLILDLISLIIMGEEYTLQSSLLYSFLHPPSLHPSTVQILLSCIYSWCVPFNFTPTRFSLTFLMAYSKVKLKSSGDTASHHSLLFWIEKLSHKCLPTQTLLYLSFKHILISLNRFMGTPNTMRILYNTSLLTESKAFLRSMDRWCTVSLYSHFSPVSDECKISDQ